MTGTEGEATRDGPAVRGRLRRPPENELPGALPLDLVIGRAEDAAVALTDLHVYSSGVVLGIRVLLRAADEDERVMGQVFAEQHSAASGTALLLGVEYADGRRATNLRPGPHAVVIGADPDELVMASQGGNWGSTTAELMLWLTPGPPAGDLLVLCAWPHRGIRETRTTVVGAVLADAGKAVAELWAYEPEPLHTAPPVADPPVVPEGWFSETLRARR